MKICFGEKTAGQGEKILERRKNGEKMK